MNSSFVIGQGINSEIFPGIFSNISGLFLKYLPISCIEKSFPLKVIAWLSLCFIIYIWLLIFFKSLYSFILTFSNSSTSFFNLSEVKCPIFSDILSTDFLISLLSSSKIEIHKPCMFLGILSFSTLNAFLVWLVIKIFFPCAKKCPSKLAMVWVFPVPGGPWTTTASFLSICFAISTCSLFVSFTNKISSSFIFLLIFFSLSFSLLSIIPTNSKSWLGISPKFCILSTILSIAFTIPVSFFLIKINGLSSISISSSFIFSISSSSKKYPLLLSLWINFLKKSSTSLFFKGCKFFSLISSSNSKTLPKWIPSISFRKFVYRIVEKLSFVKGSSKIKILFLASKSIFIFFNKIG